MLIAFNNQVILCILIGEMWWSFFRKAIDISSVSDTRFSFRILGSSKGIYHLPPVLSEGLIEVDMHF